MVDVSLEIIGHMTRISGLAERQKTSTGSQLVDISPVPTATAKSLKKPAAASIAGSSGSID